MARIVGPLPVEELEARYRAARDATEARHFQAIWLLAQEPSAHRHFATLADLEAVIAERCRRLEAAVIRPRTDFHWWPKPIAPN